MLATVAVALIAVAFTPAAASFSLGVKTGDWIEYDVQGSLSPEYGLKLGFLNVTGTSLAMEVTQSTLTGALLNHTENIDFATNQDFPIAFLRAHAYLIPNGSEVGDTVDLGVEFGNRTILSETTGTYAGVTRNVACCNFTLELNQYTFYWDKQTGVLVEAIMSHDTASNSLSAIDTNMWTGWSGWLLWPIIGAVIILGILTSRKKLIKKPDAKSTAQKVEKTVSVALIRRGLPGLQALLLPSVSHLLPSSSCPLL
jgi:hypothetical protein